MKTFLFIVTEIESANGICTKAVMNSLIEQSNRVICIINKEYGYENVFTDNGIEYHCVKPRFVYSISSLLCHNKKLSKVKRIGLSIAFNVLNKAELLLSAYSWPVISKKYSKRIYKKAEELLANNSIDAIVPIFTQIDTLIAANKVKSKNEIKYIPYFLDSLSGGYGPRVFSKERIVKRGLYWEERLLCNADRIIMMESSRLHHECYSKDKSYYDRIIFLDLPLLSKNKVDEGKTMLVPSKINLVYAGSLPSGIRSPESVLHIFDKIDDDNWSLIFVGDKTDELMKAESKDKRVHAVGRCDHNTAMGYINQASILINIGNKNSNMAPSKIFEYMSFKKPIINFYEIEDEPSIRYLDKYPCCLQINVNSCDKNTIDAIREFVNKYHKAYVVDDLTEIYRKNTPQMTSSAMLEIL